MLLRNATYLAPTMHLHQADIHVKEGVIAAIMPRSDAGSETTDQVIDCTDLFLLPGLFNAHFHSQSNAGRGLFRNMGLHDWAGPSVQGQLQQRFFDFLDHGATDDELRTICLHAYVELLRQGITFTQDSGLGERSAVLLMEAANAAGIRAVIDAYAQIDMLHDQQVGHVRFGGHLPEEEDITSETLAEATRVRATYDTILMTHCLETPQRTALVHERYGRSSVKLFDDHGLLSPRTVLFHGVELTDDDIELLATRGSSLVHCPVSNLSAIAPLGKCITHGVNVALGTDFGYADLWETMRVAFYLQKGRAGNPLVDAEAIWRMATIGGARAYQLGGSLGAIAEGYAADLVFVDSTDPALLPLVEHEGFTNGLHNLLIWGRPQMVRHVMIAGNWVVRNQQVTTVDEHELVARYRRIVQRSMAS